MATRLVSDQPLRVAPEVLGRPLASPLRRMLALLVDGLVLLLPANAIVVAVAILALRIGDPFGYQALRLLTSETMSAAATPGVLRDARREAARLLVQIEAPDLPPAVVLAVSEGRLDDAAARLADLRLILDLRLDGQHSPPRSGCVHAPVDRLIPGPLRAIVLLGVPALYFTVLTSRWRTTLGKRLLGLDVVRLDGERLSLLESFERFTGYLHVPALLGWPILDLWHDPNRQLPHDRTVRTVVLRRQRPQVKKPVAEAPPAITEEAPTADDSIGEGTNAPSTGPLDAAENSPAPGPRAELVPEKPGA